jgi:hypothetical protein
LQESNQGIVLGFDHRGTKRVRAAFVNLAHGVQVAFPIDIVVRGCKEPILSEIETGQKASESAVTVRKGVNGCKVRLISRRKDEWVENSPGMSFLAP